MWHHTTSTELVTVVGQADAKASAGVTRASKITV